VKSTSASWCSLARPADRKALFGPADHERSNQASPRLESPSRRLAVHAFPCRLEIYGCLVLLRVANLSAEYGNCDGVVRRLWRHDRGRRRPVRRTIEQVFRLPANSASTWSKKEGPRSVSRLACTSAAGAASFPWGRHVRGVRPVCLRRGLQSALGKPPTSRMQPMAHCKARREPFSPARIHSQRSRFEAEFWRSNFAKQTRFGGDSRHRVVATRFHSKTSGD